MATVNEQIVTGRAHRVLIDKVAKLWQKISFWTKSSDVEFNDGKSAETKVGAIDGITDSLASTSSRIAASAKALSTVNNKLAGRTIHCDYANKIALTPGQYYTCPSAGLAIAYGKNPSESIVDAAIYNKAFSETIPVSWITHAGTVQALCGKGDIIKYYTNHFHTYEGWFIPCSFT